VSALQDAIADALAAGMSGDEIHRMVQIAFPEHAATLEEMVPVYSDVPEGMIDLSTAKERYGYSRQLLHLWTKKGKLKRAALLKDHKSGNDISLYYEADLKHSKNEQGFSELPAGLITVPTAAKKYGYSPTTVHEWIKKGYVASKGRLLSGGGPGGGPVLIAESELLQFLSRPRKKGGRPPRS
jgi:hypothetical protein